MSSAKVAPVGWCPSDIRASKLRSASALEPEPCPSSLPSSLGVAGAAA